MKAFHTIAVPHDDILSGRYDMDVYAARLGDVAKNIGVEEYRDKDMFFSRTYETEGLKNILSAVEDRLKQRGGDPIIQITTPFGGGKTHALIALYHKSKEWNANTVVISGTDLSGEVPLWEIMEEQLTGKVEVLKGYVSPGKEKLKQVFADKTPLLILMDEVAEYAEKAAAVVVGDSTLAAQTITFMQDLGELIGETPGACLAFTLPSSTTELAGPKAEEMRDKLQKVTGRVEKIYSPVQDNEISMVIRKRLFREIDEISVKDIVNAFVRYAQNENILPEGMEATEYRDRFLDSYPFMPEVIDTLYMRWGSFPSFQRTRGVLRLLSLVIGSLKSSSKEYISLADIDLDNKEIRNELLKHIGPEFNSIIAQDITGINSGSKTVDDTIGVSYRGLKIGTRTSTTIFMYSFSGGSEKGATVGEIKRSASVRGNPASVVADALSKLETKLFYLQRDDDRYYFDNQANLNRLFITKKENVKEDDILKEERSLLKKYRGGKLMEVVEWPQKTMDIPDTERLTLVIMRDADENFMLNVLEKKGSTPRVNKNMVVFLSPGDSQRRELESAIKEKIAWNSIRNDEGSLNLTDIQKKEVGTKCKDAEENVREAFFSAYTVIYLPDRSNSSLIVVRKKMGVPTYGLTTPLDERVAYFLKEKNSLVPKLSPKVLSDKYLKNNDFASVKNIYQSWLKTPGELRVLSREVLEKSVREGVRNKIFGFGYLVDSKPECKYFGDEPTLSFSDEEVIIKEELCNSIVQPAQPEASGDASGSSTTATSSIDAGTQKPLSSDEPTSSAPIAYKESVNLRFKIPKGQVSSIAMGVLVPLGKAFDDVEIVITAKNGKISETEYENKVKETLMQLGIDADEDEGSS